jgi:hypothetical protein
LFGLGACPTDIVAVLFGGKFEWNRIDFQHRSFWLQTQISLKKLLMVYKSNTTRSIITSPRGSFGLYRTDGSSVDIDIMGKDTEAVGGENHWITS